MTGNVGVTANIHHFTSDPAMGEIHYDDDGDERNGYYYEICDVNGLPLHSMIGPYHRASDAEDAANAAACSRSYID